jgi:elongation factor Ts
MIRAEEVKELRARTGVSMMECKKALEEAGGDFEKALEILASRGAAVAEKKSSRATSAGLIEAYVHGNGTKGALVELLCETDFVARSAEFKTLAHDLAMQAVVSRPSNVEAFTASPFLKDESRTVREEIERVIGVLGENIRLGRFSVFEL